MIPELRNAFNKNFSVEKYEQYLTRIENLHPGAMDFRNAETPIFVPKDFAKKTLGVNLANEILIKRAIAPEKNLGRSPL